MAASRIALIVGLGNPGPEYAHTRHNVGYWFVDRLSREGGCSLKHEARFFGRLGRLIVGGAGCWLLTPQTFMNLSGQSAAAFANYYQIPHESILVVHDELDLPPGTVRLKHGGGHGGHKGLRDVIAALGDGGFVRLRLGIGHPGVRERVTPYVLSRPAEDERLEIEAAIEAAAETLPSILDGDLARAMNRLHRRDKTADPSPR